MIVRGMTGVAGVRSGLGRNLDILCDEGEGNLTKRLFKVVWSAGREPHIRYTGLRSAVTNLVDDRVEGRELARYLDDGWTCTRQTA